MSLIKTDYRSRTIPESFIQNAVLVGSVKFEYGKKEVPVLSTKTIPQYEWSAIANGIERIEVNYDLAPGLYAIRERESRKLIQISLFPDKDGMLWAIVEGIFSELSNFYEEENFLSPIPLLEYLRVSQSENKILDRRALNKLASFSESEGYFQYTEGNEFFTYTFVDGRIETTFEEIIV